MTICPFCDSQDVKKIEITDTYPIPFCGDVPISHPTYKCNNCGESGDFDNTLDKDLSKLIEQKHAESASTLMDALSEHGITMTYFEKALRLPFRTTARWRRGRISHSSLALLRLIRFSPLLLTVADDNFSRKSIANYQVSKAFDFFAQNTTNAKCLLATDGNSVFMGFTGDKTTTTCQPKLLWESNV